LPESRFLPLYRPGMRLDILNLWNRTVVVLAGFRAVDANAPTLVPSGDAPPGVQALDRPQSSANRHCGLDIDHVSEIRKTSREAIEELV